MARKARQAIRDEGGAVAPMVGTSIRLPPAMRAAVAALAAREGTTINAQILAALHHWIARARA